MLAATRIAFCLPTLMLTRTALPMSQAAGGSSTPPNILVIVLDDIGMDQASFAPYGWNATPLAPHMPVLAEIAAQGVSFTNFWSTPECSPTRAALLTGRYGFRTGVVTAIIDPMLPVNQLHPSEITIPKLLGDAGYTSAMIGKYHLGGGPENTPPGYGYEAPATSAGLDFYDGYWDLPPSIDTTVGGQLAAGSSDYSCGSPGGLGVVGAACFLDGSCMENIAPFEAMALGGTPLLDADGNLAATCADGDCAAIDFTIHDAYYAWPRVITQADGSFVTPPDPQREYLTSFISRRSEQWTSDAGTAAPWLLFTTHSASHTPIQPPPPSLSVPQEGEPDCALGDGSQAYRDQFKRMCESVDRSIGRMLVDMGLATGEDESFELVDPAKTNTMIVVVDDNGSLGNTVLPPFAPRYAKQTVYQTGVWCVCMVVGPMVEQPGRAVDEMVNAVDLFGLICDAGGVDWASRIPAYRTVDSRPMMPYLTDPGARPQRDFNFAVYGEGTFAPGQVGPCVIASQVVDGLITTPELCTDNGGCWAGGSAQAPYRTEDYCDLLEQGSFECGGRIFCVSADDPFCESGRSPCGGGGTCAIAPTVGQWGLMMGRWKIVVSTYPSCLAPNDCAIEFFHMGEPNPPLQPALDTPGSAAEIDTSDMTPEQQAMYDLLRTKLYDLLVSEWYCPGDGNQDKRVDELDLQGVLDSWGGPGFWDIDEDGVTDGDDLGSVLGYWNPDCIGQIDPAGQHVPDCLKPARR